MLKDYLNSFKLKKKFWQTFLIDFIALAIIFASILMFSNYFQNRALAITGGKSVEQIQEWALSSPEQALPFFEGLKSLLVFGGILLFVIIIGSFLLYSFSQALIWNALADKKLTSKNYWKWNLLLLALLIPLALGGLLYLLIKVLFDSLLNFLLTLSSAFYLQHTELMEIIQLTLSNFASFFLILMLLLLIFLVYYSFVREYKVWQSIGEGFHLFRLKWNKLWRILLFVAFTVLIITFILIPIKKIFPDAFASTIINLAVALLFLAWMRIYVLENVK